MTTTMLQAMILVAVYERGHGIYPAAYLTHRAWWAVINLERSMNVDWPNRALCTPDPAENYYLPVLDEDWNNGTYPNAPPYTVSSPCAEKMGKFARLAQAAHLLSRVLRHVSDTEISRNFLREERNTLDRAIRSLLSLTVSEEELCGVVYCSPVAVLRSYEPFQTNRADST
ncbi:hypothetical protein RU639_004540 [Aspergillus parasiticus]